MPKNRKIAGRKQTMIHSKMSGPRSSSQSTEPRETKTDIYTQEEFDREHSLRFIHIVARNVVGILNRIASLMRRKRYNMEEVSVAFDHAGRAHMTLAVDGRKIDVAQAIHQLHKLYDVFEVYDVTDKRDRLYNIFDVVVPQKKLLNNFPILTHRILPNSGCYKGVFIVSLDETPAFLEFLRKKKYSYVRRILSLI
ncbi:hypothetical protein HYV57_02450 [Candidatus Peregrinibacteria bacterium]|nr:hypothetical protein [Candidatus Peregrinibacteria bacterium]